MIKFTHDLMTRPYEITSYYGPRSAPVKGGSTMHRGVDIVSEDWSVWATREGKVVSNYWNDFRGWVLIIEHHNQGTTFQTLYQHLANKSRLKVGDKVNAGAFIAYMGATGLPGMGAHLHFELRYKGKPIDPLPYLIAEKEDDMTKEEVKKIAAEVVSNILIGENNEVPEWVLKDKDYQLAIELGITDGSRAAGFTRRYESAIQAARAYKRGLEDK